MLVLQNSPLPEGLALGEARVTPLLVDGGSAKFDLTLTLEERGEGLEGWLEYNTDLFEAATVARLAGHLQVLLAAMVARPLARLSQLPMLSSDERRLLETWSVSAAASPCSASTIPSLFEAQLCRNPHAIAVRFGARQLSYAELDARANQLAHLLQRRGVRADTRVAIALERSPDLVIALLAVLKAGGAYVALDPAYPSARLELMLADSGAQLLLTEPELAPRFAEARVVQLILPELRAALAEMPSSAPVCPARPDSLAYVSYTSGSTGRPKGVAVPHRAVVRLVQRPDYASWTPEDTFLLLAPVAFDASTLELWASLLNGAILAVAPPGLLGLDQLGTLLREERVTTLWLTAGLFHQLAEYDPGALAGLRQLLAGGDVLSPETVRRVLAANPDLRLINGYGPTENTTFTACFPVSSAALGASVPIGRPIPQTSVYVLDAQLQPVPVGVPGELYTGGAGLARGYLGRPDLTAERFVPNPFAADQHQTADDETQTGAGSSGVFGRLNVSAPCYSDARLYRTGDRVRWRADGTLEFLGRADQQVKIRGFRIELGEIRAVLAAHPQVGTALVQLREDSRGEKRLVAYVTPAPGADAASLDALDLREWAAGQLPAAMVPGAVVALEALPLTPNGKVDQRALPEPAEPAGETVYQAPRTPTEQRLVAIWEQVLRRERIGIHEHFFEAGGHSLLATLAISHIRTEFRLELPLRTLFETPTVAALATQIDVLSWAAASGPHEQAEDHEQGYL
jgi:amino acid adenylation domain-containing protein